MKKGFFKRNKLSIMVTIIILLALTLMMVSSNYNGRCIQQGHDGLTTFMLIPIGCYDNNNPLGVNDVRGYTFYPLPTGD